ncbi:hypothetical protein QR680_014598 [Steinernema hermaphroditum]|uniref:Serine/threonine-protein phosphatase PGAM5, mitochondrial n=1 Tax=Steinernema hermaphroditum TaxID=289476 RepID=A0AA39IC48_9BILA|nr:hypothetical protein QR680_014598 [Steinernema hermaphroditum]
MVILTRFARYGAFGAAALSSAYFLRDEAKAFVGSKTSFDSSFSSSSTSFNDNFPRGKWDYNWDSRDPMSMVDEAKYEAADAETRKEMLEKAKPTATRHIFLIRHGQYHTESDIKNLTELGRQQASMCGERLAKSGFKFNAVTMSTMNRATETANLILAELPKDIPIASDSVLEEGAPYPPEPPVAHWRPKQKFFAEGSRIEAAFRKYIHRASKRQKEDSYEVIVCHANVIRYFICRALQFPPEGWLRMSLGHSSITWLTIRPNGNVSIRSIGDIGHLPSEKSVMVILARLTRYGAFGVAAVSSAYFLRQEAKSFVGSKSSFQSSHSSNSPLFNDDFPRAKWNHNWDNRDPISMVDERKYNAADNETRNEMLEKATPKAIRNIFLIRHGQYNTKSDVQNLTELGRQQASICGERLAKSGFKFNIVTMSTMTRATETANLILAELPKDISVASDSILEEGAPYPAEPPSSRWRPKEAYFTQGSRIEAAFRKYIHRAPTWQKEDSYEAIVCHANVIRYFICRALQFPPEGWLRMSLGHSSITWVRIRPNGHVSIRSIGDIGHLPSEKVSFS